MSNIIKWNKPSVGRLKCNIDVTNINVGISVCIIDDERLFVASQTEWFSPSTEVNVGEALGLLATINWIHEFGFDSVDFELDAKSVVDNVNVQQPNDSNFGAFTRDCNSLLDFCLGSVMLS